MKEQKKRAINSILLKDSNRNQLDQFIKLYNEDPLSARVFSITNEITVTSTWVFEYENGDFKIEVRKIRNSVNSLLKKYFSKKIDKEIFYSKGLFYLKMNKKLTQLTYSSLASEEKEYIYGKFPWIKMFEENNLPCSFNYAIKNKLFSTKSIIRKLYGCPYNKAKHFHSLFISSSTRLTMPQFKYYMKTMDNIENTNVELLDNWSFLQDSLEMAYKLNRKINMAWSKRRLKEEHDDMSVIIANVLLSSSDRSMNISEIFIEIEEELEAKLLRTTKELAIEGLKQRHCVAGYVHAVERGNTAIYHKDGYTLQVNYGINYAGMELGENTHYLYVNQFRGFANISAPEELMLEVKSKLKKINIERFNFLQKEQNRNNVYQVQDFPF